jgi:dTDP-glucose 4,6-dehydratase
VEDHARGIELVLKKGRVGENYNIGGHNEWANIDIVNLMCRLMDEAFSANTTLIEMYPMATKAYSGKSADLISYVTDRDGHDRRYAIDATKTKNELGYKPVESFETGIKKTLIWYLGSDFWWQPLVK